MGHDECEIRKEVPGLPNTALAFLNARGVHSASIPENAAPKTYRHLYQLRLGPDWSTTQRLLKSMPKDVARRWQHNRTDAAY